MNTSQYTIRGIPNALIKKVEAEARRTKRSKNAVFLEALTAAIDIKEEARGKWYEKFVGTMSEEDAMLVEEASRDSRVIHPKDYL